jgi:hypothetical protein
MEPVAGVVRDRVDTIHPPTVTLLGELGPGERFLRG